MKTFRSNTPIRRATLIALIALFALAAIANVPRFVFADSTYQVERTRVFQVNLAQHAKISQYLDIDSTERGYGKNACGLVAVAAAIGGEDWLPFVYAIANAAGSDYGPETGIQPSKLVNTLHEVLGESNVTAYNNTTIEKMYDELAKGNIVIVDVQVNEKTAAPSTVAPNYAHFARVLGIDMLKQEIYLENTLRGDAYWTMSLRDFIATWEYPETAVSLIPASRQAEPVTRWMVVLDDSLIPDREL
jgi:hypothetical protein